MHDKKRTSSFVFISSDDLVHVQSCFHFFMEVNSKGKEYIEDVYFFEVNTKYISSNVLKISVISGVRSTSEIADIFNT